METMEKVEIVNLDDLEDSVFCGCKSGDDNPY